MEISLLLRDGRGMPPLEGSTQDSELQRLPAKEGIQFEWFTDILGASGGNPRERRKADQTTLNDFHPLTGGELRLRLGAAPSQPPHDLQSTSLPTLTTYLYLPSYFQPSPYLCSTDL
jgi:hypothetical protein